MKIYKSALTFAICSLLAACGSNSNDENKVGSDNSGDDNNQYNTSVVTPKVGKALTIHMIGDSTMAPYSDDRRPQMGWAEQMPMFFDNVTEVNNWARGGRSSLSFYNYDPSKNPHWPNIQPAIQSGEYVIIQFGHNDQKYGADYEQYGTYAFCSDGSTTADGAEGCPDTEHSYYLNLKKYVNEVKEVGAIPILMSPIVRAYFEAEVISPKGQHNIGVLDDETNARGDYPAAMKALADRYNIAYVDLTAATKIIVEQYGSTGYTNLYFNDSTHPNGLYAALIAKAAAESLQELGIMTDHIVTADTMIVTNPSELDFGKRYIDDALCLFPNARNGHFYCNITRCL